MMQTFVIRKEKKWRLGFSLVELLVGIGISGLGMLAVSQILVNMAQMKASADLIGTLQELHSQIESAALNPRAWQATINDPANPSMQCLAKGTACTPNAPAAFKLVLPTPAGGSTGVEVFDSTILTRGFTLKGGLCNEWTAAGNPACPTRFDLAWNAECPAGKPTCRHPQVHVAAQLNVAGIPKRILTINPNNYSVNVMVGTALEVQPLLLFYQMNNNSGEGLCTVNTWMPRKFNTVAADPGNNISGVSQTPAGSTSFTLQPGSYTCQVTAPAFRTGTSQLEIVSLAGDPMAPITGPGSVVQNATFGSAQLTVSASFTLTKTTTLAVNQFCSASAGPFDFGMPVPEAGGAYNYIIYSVVTCNRTTI